MPELPITREDLEDGFRRTAGGAGERMGEARRPLLVVALVAGGVLVAAAYLIGRRIGRTRSTIVEVRRI